MVTIAFGVGIATIQGMVAWSLRETYKMRQELSVAQAQIAFLIDALKGYLKNRHD